MDNLLLSLFSTSLVMSVVILAFFTLNKFFPRVFSTKARYAVWLVMLMGFLIPFRPTIGNGVLQIPVSDSIRVNDGWVRQPAMNETTSFTDNQLKGSDTENEPVSNFPNSFPYISIILTTWGVVAILLLISHILRYVYFLRMVKRWGTPVKDEIALSILATIQKEVGLGNKRVDTKICKFISSSMLVGFIRPMILLPENHYEEEEWKLIFKHELIHLKRRDLLVKLLSVIVTCLHWFNPFIYILCAELQTDGESCCDEVVLQNADIEDRRFYGEIIIGMIGRKDKVRTALSTCFYAGKSNMKKRLEFIMEAGRKMKNATFATIVVLTATLTILSGSVFAFSNHSIKEPLSNRKAAASTNPPSTPTAEPESIVTPPITTNSEITLDQAKEIAISKVGGGTATNCEVDYENGRKVCDVEIVYGGKKYEMNVDLLDSTISNYEVEMIGNELEDDDFNEDDHDDVDDYDHDDDHDDVSGSVHDDDHNGKDNHDHEYEND